MPKIHQALSFIHCWLNAVDEHSLHGPFVYRLYTEVIKPDQETNNFEDLDRLRGELRQDHTLIELQDLGAGSTVTEKSVRTVNDIARHSLTPAKYSRLYFRLIRYFQLQNIVELGTSLGLNTLYLARNPQCQVATFEGCEETARYARQIFRSHSPASNVKLVVGDISLTLTGYLKELEKIDFVLFDANHLYEPTLRYFQYCKARAHHNSVFVFDDIHLSPSMEKAWQHIIKDPDVTLSLDLFRVGIAFFNNKLSKQHFVLKF